MVGDKGFDSDKLRRELEDLGHTTCFPGKKNRRCKAAYTKKLYRRRYRVENFFCRIKRWACLSLRRDKLALHFSSLLAFAAFYRLDAATQKVLKHCLASENEVRQLGGWQRKPIGQQATTPISVMQSGNS